MQRKTDLITFLNSMEKKVSNETSTVSTKKIIEDLKCLFKMVEEDACIMLEEDFINHLKNLLFKIDEILNDENTENLKSYFQQAKIDLEEILKRIIKIKVDYSIGNELEQLFNMNRNCIKKESIPKAVELEKKIDMILSEKSYYNRNKMESYKKVIISFIGRVNRYLDLENIFFENSTDRLDDIQCQSKFLIDLKKDEPDYERLNTILNTQKELEENDQFERIVMILKNSIDDDDDEFNIKLIIENMYPENFDYFRLSIYKDYVKESINDLSLYDSKNKFYNNVFYEEEWNEKKKTYQKEYVTCKTKTKTIEQVQQEIEKIKTIELD